MSVNTNQNFTSGKFGSLSELTDNAAQSIREEDLLFVKTNGVSYSVSTTQESGGVAINNTSPQLYANPNSSGGGESNTASNVGTGEGVFAQKSGVDLQFKSLKATGGASIISDSDSITINVSGAGGDMTQAVYDPTGVNGDAFDMDNMVEGPTSKILTQSERDAVAANTLKLSGIEAGAEVNIVNGLSEGSNVTITDLGGGIFQISVAGGGGGEANTASNVGSGTGQLFYQKSGVDLKFKSLVSGSFVIFENGATTVAVNDSAIQTALDGKVNTEVGKGLSEEDFTSTLLSKLNGIQSGAQVNPSSYAWGLVTGEPNTIQGYGIDNGVRTDLSSQTISGSLVLTSQMRVSQFYSTTNSQGALRYSSSQTALSFDGSGVNFSVAPKPVVNGGVSCGTAGRLYSEVFAQNTSINPSDARLKTEVRSLSEAEKATALAIKESIGIYQWLRAIEDKGKDEARLHCGPTVQRVMQCFEDNGLDPFRYGIVCYDEYDDIWDTDKEAMVKERVDLYSLRPTQLVMFIMASL